MSTLKEKIKQEAIKYAEFNKFTSDRPFEFNRDKTAFTNGAYFYFDKIADDYAIDFSEWISTQGYREYSNGWSRLWDKGIYTTKELLEIFKKEKEL